MVLVLRANKVVEEFLMIVVCLWLFRYKILKTHSILMEVVFFLEVEKTVRLVVIKIMHCMPHLALLLKNSLIQRLQV